MTVLIPGAAAAAATSDSPKGEKRAPNFGPRGCQGDCTKLVKPSIAPGTAKLLPPLATADATCFAPEYAAATARVATAAEPLRASAATERGAATAGTASWGGPLFAAGPLVFAADLCCQVEFSKVFKCCSSEMIRWILGGLSAPAELPLFLALDFAGASPSSWSPPPPADFEFRRRGPRLVLLLQLRLGTSADSSPERLPPRSSERWTTCAASAASCGSSSSPLKS